MCTRQYLYGCCSIPLTPRGSLVGAQDLMGMETTRGNSAWQHPHVFSLGVYFTLMCPETLLKVEFKINGKTGLRELSGQTVVWLLPTTFSKVDGDNCEHKQSKGVWTTSCLPRKGKKIS